LCFARSALSFAARFSAAAGTVDLEAATISPILFSVAACAIPAADILVPSAL
jgi:hypothetical protein